MLLYTQNPRRVAGSEVDGAYTIVDDELVMSGNSDTSESYRHKLWDYSSDYVVVRGWFGAWVVSVQRKALELDDPNNEREIVCLTPACWIPAPFSWLWKYGPDLVRRKFDVGGGVNVCSYLAPTTPDGPVEQWLSVGLSGQRHSIDIPADRFFGILVRFLETTKPEISTMERFLGLVKTIQAPEAMAPLLFHIMRKLVLARAVAVDWTGPLTGQAYLPGGGVGGAFHSRPDSLPQVEHYQARGPSSEGFLQHEEGKQYARCIGPPLLTNPAVVPAKGHNNELASVNGRVKRVGNNILPTDSRVGTWATDFADELVGRAKRLHPLSLEEVKEMQDNPAQRMRAERNFNWDSPLTAEQASGSCFVKAEAYGGENDPRNITTTQTSHMQEMSTYTYAFKKHVLKQLLWYSPGMSPRAIADRVQDLARQSEVLVETDFSRFDGTISPYLSGIVSSIYERSFDPKHRDHIGKLWRSEVVAGCRTKHGVQFRACGGRMSGSPQTTDGNTIINGLFVYLTFRRSGYDHAEAWKRLGLYCGDDGLSCCNPDDLQWTASQLGLKIDVIVRPRGGPVGYLGRIFIDPWTTGVSVQDPARTMAKIHITTADSSIPTAVAATWRARGYLAMDPHAPVVSNYCRYIIRCYGAEYAEWAKKKTSDRRKAMLEAAELAEMPYWVRGETESWPSVGEDSGERYACYSIIASQLGVDVPRLKNLEKEIDAAADRSSDRPVTKWDHVISNDRKPKLYAEVSGSGPSKLVGQDLPRKPVPDQPSNADVLANYEVGRVEVERNPTLPPLVPEDHTGLPTDDREHMHRHNCQKCGAIFPHSHKILRDPEARAARQLRYRTWCRKCQRP
jgi:hypothetical protein